MKLSKKLKTKIKKIVLLILVVVALVTTTLAIFKLADFSMPIKKINSIQAQLEAETELQEEIQILSDEVTNDDTTVGEVVICDSIVQGVRDNNLPDGNYTFRVKGYIDGIEEIKDYAVELINYYDDVTYSLAEGETQKIVTLGDDSTEYKMLVVKYHKNLTIDSGVTITATNVSNLTYKKGMYLCVMGEMINKGEITMTARGTYNQEGENVYLWKNINNTYEYVPALGGIGGDAISYTWKSSSSTDYYSAGKAGTDGEKRGTGGGGSGALGARRYNYSSGSRKSGAGTSGTAYSGGTGGGGINTNYGGTYYAGDGAPNGGAGGAGFSYRGNTSWAKRAGGGGAGNIGGMGKYTTSKAGVDNPAYSGQNGTGGLLVIYADDLYNLGKISSNGSNGGPGSSGGGSSGGGSINIFANNVSVNNSTTVDGGISVSNGGAGGLGTTTINELKADLIYPKKTLELNIGDTYTIDKKKLSYMNQNGIQTNLVSLGTLEYEILDTTIAGVNSNGIITGKTEGKTLVKITDVTNNISTYIYLEVIDNVKVDVQEGKNFTVALKRNGTVWSYGLNDNGQLGISNNENRIEPTQIPSLNNIKAIASGFSHSLALSKSGEVYAWGLGVNGQLGTGDELNSNLPVKVDGISNIEKIDAYKNISIALSNDGKVYVWGEGYSTLPMRVVLQENVIDISGTLILTENGTVYDITDTSVAIEGLSNIAKISCGTGHNLALTINGVVYTWGTNTYGECGTDTTGNIEVIAIAAEVYEISAGNCISMLQDENGKVYAFGDNSKGQLGFESTAKVTNITEIVLAENVKIGSISCRRRNT